MLRRLPVWGKILLAVVAAAILIPLSLFLLVVALYSVNAFNPMQLAFLESFVIANDSGADVRVTPIGMVQGSGEYASLPRYRDRFPPAIPSRDRYDIPLKAGQSLKITYDWDDMNFRHILVRAKQGAVLVVDTDKMGDLHSCYGPQKEKYSVPPLASLKEAPSELVPCAEGEAVRYSGAK